MPWANFSNWTDEDRHAVVVYLRHIPAVRRQIPPPVSGDAVDVSGAIEVDYVFKNYDVESTRKK